MKEFIYSRNAVFETLCAKRGQVFRLEIANEVQEKRRLVQILEMTGQRGEPVFGLILDTLQDPPNLGTRLRTTEAVGVHGAVLPLADGKEPGNP